jgi:hypothetical protein
VAEYVTCWCECIASEKITPTLGALLSTCNSTPVKNMGFWANQHLLLCEMIHPLGWNKASSLNTARWGQFLQHTYAAVTILLNSVLLHYMHCSASEPQMSYMHANAAVLLYFMVIKQLIAMKVATKISYRHLHYNSKFGLFFLTVHLLYIFLLLKMQPVGYISLICKSFLCVHLAHQEIFIWKKNHTFYTHCTWHRPTYQK